MKVYMKQLSFNCFLAAVLFVSSINADAAAGTDGNAPAVDLWKLANERAQIHRFSTLIDSHGVKRFLSDETGLQAAIDWCKQTGVTKVYVEEFRDGYQAERATLENAKKRFLE